MHTEFDTEDNFEPSASTAGMSRRSLVRTGAHMAWAVPAISLVTAAPALAVSGPAVLRIGSFSVNYANQHRRVDVAMGPIRNNGGSDAGQVTVDVKVPEKSSGPFRSAPALVDGPSTGWQFAGRSGHGPWHFTFVSTDAHLRPDEKTRPLDFVLKLERANHGPRVTITAMAFGEGDSDTASDTLPAF